MNKPTLYIFTISHFCEKARWALDYLNVDYHLKVIAPGTHLQIAKKLGLKRGSTPFLETGDGVIQGSDTIINWAEEQSNSTSLQDPQNAEAVSEIEARLDKELGVHIRRWFYSEAVVEQPHLVKPIFMRDISAWEKIKFSIKWPVIQKLMIKRMDLGKEQGEQSFTIVQNEMAWLESLLKDTPFLAGNQLSRADIAAAALIAPMIKPGNHPTAKYVNHPPRVAQQSTTFQDSAVWSWVENLYSQYRLAEN